VAGCDRIVKLAAIRAKRHRKTKRIQGARARPKKLPDWLWGGIPAHAERSEVKIKKCGFCWNPDLIQKARKIYRRTALKLKVPRDRRQGWHPQGKTESDT